MQLKDKIVTSRKNKGLTQEQLADLANVTVRTIQRIESGETTPRSYTLKTIAAALAVPFEELQMPSTDQSLVAGSGMHAPTLAGGENDRHGLEMISLSCFAYIVIPFVHFLLPAYLLKRSKPLHPVAIAFARRVIRLQVAWQIVLNASMLATLAFNLLSAAWFKNTHPVNYLWPLFIMYGINAGIILTDLSRIKKLAISSYPPV